MLGDVPGIADVIGNVPKVRVVFFRAQNFFADFSDPFLLSSSILARIQGPRLSADLGDHGSGIDLKTLVIKLNGTAIFDGMTPPTTLPVFPDRLEVLVGDRPLTTLGPNVVQNAVFDRVRFNYFPSRPKLQANNTLEEPVFKDRGGNAIAAPLMSTFTWP